jgi:hypothetical protein
MPEGIGYGPRSNALAALGRGSPARRGPNFSATAPASTGVYSPTWRPPEKESQLLDPLRPWLLPGWTQWATVDGILKTLHEMIDPHLASRERGDPGYSEILDKPLGLKRKKAPSPFPLSDEELRARLEGDSGPSITQDTSETLEPTGSSLRDIGRFIKEVILPQPGWELATELVPGGAMVGMPMKQLAKEAGIKFLREPTKEKPFIGAMAKGVRENVLEVLSPRKRAAESRAAGHTVESLSKTGQGLVDVVEGYSAGVRTLTPEQVTELNRLGIDPYVSGGQHVIGRKKSRVTKKGKVLQGGLVKSKILRSDDWLRRQLEEVFSQPEISESGRAFVSLNDYRRLAYKKKRTKKEQLLFEQTKEEIDNRVLDALDRDIFGQRRATRLAAKVSRGEVVDEATRINYSREGVEQFGHPTGRASDVEFDPSEPAYKIYRDPTQQPFPEGSLPDVALPHGTTSDGMSSTFRKARAEGRRLPTSEELETGVDFAYAIQGMQTPVNTTRVLQAWEPEELFDITLRGIVEGDITAKGRKWYNLFNEEMRKIVGEANMPEFASVWALLSPQNLVEANLRDALAAMRFAREYDAAVRKAGRTFDVKEFTNLFALRLREKASVKDVKFQDLTSKEVAQLSSEDLAKYKAQGFVHPQTIIGKLGKGLGPLEKRSTTFKFEGNLRPKSGDPEGTGFQIESQKTPNETAAKIAELYLSGEFKGDLKVKSFSMTTALKDLLGGAATSTNDVRVGMMFGFPDMIPGDGYLAIQHLAAEMGRELSEELGVKITTDEVQAMWWVLGASLGGTKRARDRMGAGWPHDFGSLESAVAFSKPEIALWEAAGFDKTKPFVPSTFKGGRPRLKMVTEEGEFPMDQEMFEYMTGLQLDDISHLQAQEIVDSFSAKEVAAAKAAMDKIGREGFLRTGLVK